MKKIVLIYIFGLSFLVKANSDCIDNSYHLKQPYDSKEYHKVSCNCSCEKYQIYEDRGKCSKCMHYRYPKKEKWEL